MRDSASNAALLPELRRALRYLYDQVELRKSPLIELLGVSHRKEPSLALRRLLTKAIESLKPDPAAPSQSSAWCVYEILSQRYVEQLTQREVANDRGLSLRQLQRQERRALRALAHLLLAHHGIAPALARTQEPPPRSGADTLETPPSASSREKELEWLRRSASSEPVDAAEVIQAAQKVVAALAQSLDVTIDCALPQSPPLLAVQSTTVKQALLIVLAAAIQSVPGGRVQIGVEDRRWEEAISIRAVRRRALSTPLSREQLGNLEMARQLVSLSGGSLEVTVDDSAREPFTAHIIVPAAELVPILIIDDNADTLRLYQHYLAGSRYRFVGINDPQQALPAVEQLLPQIIVVDVMLPGIDGWELLGRLRAHPKTARVPIIVCTILPQEQLALSLGAAAFIAKPLSRQTLLSALGRQLELLAREGR
jgi:CheY-like chemotaxis protein